MDTITHGITGALIAKAFFSENEDRKHTLAVTLGAVFPDIDILVSALYPERISFLKVHRGSTHSLVMLPVFALLLGVLVALWTKQRRRWILFSVLCGVGLGSHILLDVITAYGTQVWSPLRDSRVSWDTIFIIDLIFTTIALLPQLAAWVYSERVKATRRGVLIWLAFTITGVIAKQATAVVHVIIPGAALAAASLLIGLVLWIPKVVEHRGQWRSASFCRAGVIVLVLYLALCGLAHREALAQVKRFAERSGIDVERIAAIPYPPSAFGWVGLIKSPTGVYRGMIDLAVPASPSYVFFPDAASNGDVQQAKELTDAQMFLWFARFPWVSFHRTEDQSTVEIQDIQFYAPRRSGRPNFTYQAKFDSQGRLVSHGLLAR